MTQHDDSTAAGPAEQRSDGPPEPVVRDKRRIDPETGEVRARRTHPAARPRWPTTPSGPLAVGGSAEPVAAPEAVVPAPGEDVHPDTSLADERLRDLQRLQAEYVNYKRRVDRDRDVHRDVAVGSVLEALLPVLDDIHLARQHGDLEGGPFAAIADKLEARLGRFGVARFGEPGEAVRPGACTRR